MEEGSVDKILTEHSKIHPQIKPRRRKPVGLIILTLVLALIIIILGITLIMSFSPLSSMAKTYHKEYSGSLFSVQKVSGENAKALNQQIINYCPDFKLEEYYFAQIDFSGTQESLVFIINPKSGKTECKIDRRTQPSEPAQKTLSQNLIATINGEPIYSEEVMAIYNNIPAESRTNLSMQQSLDQLIADKLLFQDAAAKGFSVSEEEINNAISTFMTSNSMTLAQLEQNLANVGSSMELFRNNTRKTLLLQKEIDDITKGAAQPTDADIRKYFDENPQLFITPAKASTKQLLIYSNESNDAEKQAQIKSLGESLNGTNFCELVSKYSQDTLSVSRCGQYDFEPGQLLPEYEQVVFSSEPGSIKIIKTRIGYHLVEVISVAPPTPISFEQTKDDIANYLILKTRQDLLGKYVTTLKQNAKIESYV